jgi:hypothetical protein
VIRQQIKRIIVAIVHGLLAIRNVVNMKIKVLKLGQVRMRGIPSGQVPPNLDEGECAPTNLSFFLSFLRHYDQVLLGTK